MEIIAAVTASRSEVRLEVRVPPEDAVISDLVRASGGEIAFQDYQTFAARLPDMEAFLRNDAFLRNASSESSLLHLEGREKSRMKEALGSLERLGGVRRAKPRQFTSP